MLDAGALALAELAPATRMAIRELADVGAAVTGQPS
jgi:hypothetical protein